MTVRIAPSRNARALSRLQGIRQGLCLTASPTFAMMAVLSQIDTTGMPDMLCGTMQHASVVSGMAWMYTLMSVFHACPWLKRTSRRWHA